MESIVIDYKKIIELIGLELQDVWEQLVRMARTSTEEDFVQEVKSIKGIEISDEQNFVKKRDNSVLQQGYVYIVVRFGAGSINFSSSVTPISLLCVGTHNKVKPVQLLLSSFATAWTTKNMAQGTEYEDSSSLQVWNTPEVVTNFNEVSNGLRNLYRLSGNIVVGPEAVRLGILTYKYGDGENDLEQINIMAFQDNYHASLDSQPYGNTFNFVRSENNFSTYSFSISTYLLKGHLAADALAVRGFRYRGSDSNAIQSTFSPNDYMELYIEFTNGYTNIRDDDTNGFFLKYKVVDSSITQELGGIPRLNISFTR